MSLPGLRRACLRWCALTLPTALLLPGLAAQTPPIWMGVSFSGPPARADTALAYDSLRGRTVLFGGAGGPTGHLSDTWEWDGIAWTQRSTAGPPGTEGHAMAYDSARGVTVLFGGYGTAVGSLGFHGETWEWDGTTWTQVSSTGPSPRNNHAMAYDSARGVTVLCSGYLPAGYPIKDTWEWDGTTWTQVSTTGPSARRFHAMAYDSARGVTVLFGGSVVAAGLWRDTHEWDGIAWSMVSSSGPSARMRHSMAYDSRRGRTVLFGGNDGSSYRDDTWEWDGSAWTQVTATGPSAREDAAMAYDRGRGATMLFGGYGPGGNGDTWEFHGAFGSSATVFGAGCGTPALTLSPDPGAPPAINSTARVSMTNIQASIAFLSIGWSDTTFGPWPLPYSLASYGMPGCDLLHSADIGTIPFTPTGPGTASCGLSLPYWCGLIGVRLFLQGWAEAPGANTAGVAVSNGVEWVIGTS